MAINNGKSIIREYPPTYIMQAPPSEEKIQYAPSGFGMTNDSLYEGPEIGEEGYDPNKDWRDDGTIAPSDPLGYKDHRENQSGNKNNMGYKGTGRKNRGTGDRARLAANLSQGQSASLLTG